MKTRGFAFAAIAVLILNVVAFAAHDTRSAAAKKREATHLVSVLPASDGVVVVESKRFLNEGLPKMLAASPSVLAEVLAKLDEMAARTGIDLRKFDQVVVGVTMRQVTPTNYDFEPVAIASGDINAGALVAIARLASNGTYREEKLGGRTVYVFSAKDVIQKTALKTTTNSKIASYIDKALAGLTKELAVAALDRNTIVLGSPERVRETLAGTTHVSADVSGLLPIKETSVVSFALRTPSGLSKLLPLDNDELGINLDSIQYLSGSLDVSAVGSSIQMNARTKGPEQAKSLKDTIDGLQVVGGAIFGGSKRPDQQVYGRMIKNAKLDQRGADISLALLIPQADIDILLGGVK